MSPLWLAVARSVSKNSIRLPHPFFIIAKLRIGQSETSAGFA
jgi:hypothetical protein